MFRQLAHVQRAVRYAVDPGLTRLQEPMPPRSPTTRRMRGLDPDTGAHAAVAQAPAVPADAAPATTKPALRRPPLRLAIAGAAILAVGLLMTRVLAVGDDVDEASTISPVATAPSSTSDHGAAPARLDPTALPTTVPPATQTSPISDEADTAAMADALKRMRRTREQRQPKGERSAAESSDKDDGPSTRALLDEAASAFVLGQMPRARSIYQQVLERQPAQADAWRGLGLTAARIGLRKDAEHAFERYLKLRPNAPDAARIREQLDKVR